MTDPQPHQKDRLLAMALAAAGRDLNDAIARAVTAGLRVEVEVVEHQSMRSPPSPVITVRTLRPIK